MFEFCNGFIIEAFAVIVDAQVITGLYISGIELKCPAELFFCKPVPKKLKKSKPNPKVYKLNSEYETADTLFFSSGSSEVKAVFSSLDLSERDFLNSVVSSRNLLFIVIR